jgi:exodeoxyribonuclease X
LTLAETTFALIDTETTRREPKDPEQEVIEVAVRLIQGDGHILDEYESRIFPVHPIPPETSAIHHLTEEDLIGAPDRILVSQKLEAFIPSDAIMVAHNEEFDRLSLIDSWNNLGSRLWLCTERLAHHLVPTAPNFKLATLFYLFGHTWRTIAKEPFGAHRAAVDVQILSVVFFELLTRYKAFAEKECAGDEARLERAMQGQTLVAYARRPYTLQTWPMGPEEAFGKPFAEVDIGLLQWALRKADIRPDMRYTIEKEVKRRGG